MSVFYWVMTHGDAVLSWVLVALGGLLGKAVMSHLAGKSYADMVQRALNEVGDAVMAVEQTYVGALKDASADGTLTPEEAAAAKQKAVDMVKANLGMEGLAKLAKILGVDIDSWLGSKVEAAVGANKPDPAPKAASPQ